MNNKRILIVDDNEDVITIFSIALKFYAIKTAINGKIAVETVETWLPDLILMDIKMPVLDGIEATKIINNRYPQIQILGISAFSGKLRHHMLQAGAIEVIRKPIRISELKRRVKEFFNSNSS